MIKKATVMYLLLLLAHFSSAQQYDSTLFYITKNLGNDTASMPVEVRNEIKEIIARNEDQSHFTLEWYIVEFNEKLVNNGFFYLNIYPDSILTINGKFITKADHDHYHWSGKAFDETAPSRICNNTVITIMRRGKFVTFGLGGCGPPAWSSFSGLTLESKPGWMLFTKQYFVPDYTPGCWEPTDYLPGRIAMQESPNIEWYGNNPLPYLEDLAFCTDENTKVHYAIYDLSGRLISEPIPAQTFSAGHQSFGYRKPIFSPGMYIFRLQVNDEVYTKKVIVVPDK